MQTLFLCGGGFGNPGVHNLLEPATFGVPIIVGPNYSHFAEAIALVNMGGCISVSNKAELNAALKDLITDANFRSEKVISAAFVQMNKGATNIILKNVFR
jgi:3-deoxy-D-manno-octulosonic-acid transferase